MPYDQLFLPKSPLAAAPEGLEMFHAAESARVRAVAGYVERAPHGPKSQAANHALAV